MADSDQGSAPLSRPGRLCRVANAEACLAPAKLSSHDSPWACSQLLPQRIISCREGRAHKSSLRMTAQARMALGVSRDGHGMEDTGTDSQGRSMDRLSGQCPDACPSTQAWAFLGELWRLQGAAGGHLWTLMRALQHLVLKAGKTTHPPK